MPDQFWKPDKETERAIRRGDKKEKDWRKRIDEEYNRQHGYREVAWKNS